MNFDNKIATRQSYGEALLELGRENKSIVVLDADLSTATKTSLFAKEYPERFFDIGIAEQDMIGTAAGFATCGKIPYASSFAAFAVGRAYDQIRNSIAYPNLNVKICATHAGITVGEDGATHQMIEDIAIMRALPNMKVFCPSDDAQTKWVIKEIAKYDGPAYVRLSRFATPQIYDKSYKFEIGKAVQHGNGVDATIFATGDVVAEALIAKQELEKRGKYIRVVDFHTIKPIDVETVVNCAEETNYLFSVENHNTMGGLGTAIADVLAEHYPKKLYKLGVKDTFGKSGKATDLMKYFGVDSESIINTILEQGV